VREKNLAISGFLLLLLAETIAALVVAGYRAENFAKLQMAFVASVSHELRTPLTAIFSAGENIKDGVVTGKVGLTRYGSIVIDQSRLLMDHVDRILLFASIRSGKDRYNLRPLQVPEILQRVLKDTSALILGASCVVEQQVEPDLPRVRGDLFAVSGCLGNLITNAVKFSSGDRRIRIYAHLQEADDHKKEVAISVEDHGIGINGSELKQIFEPFYRSPETASAQIHGTGLGLSLAKHLAEAMGGRLSVTSQVGVGSIFTLYLRVADALDHDFSNVSS
jgi:two-component system phosphate regulon sensor histidine kinase PhoR